MIGGIFIGTKALCFAGGVAAAVIGRKLIKSEVGRNLCVKGLAKGMRLQKCAMETFQNIKEEAADIFTDAKNQVDAVESD